MPLPIASVSDICKQGCRCSSSTTKDFGSGKRGKPDHRYGPLRFMRRVFDKQDVRDAIVWTEAIFSPLDIWSLIRLQNTEAKDDEMCTCPYEAQPLGPPFPSICRGESDAQNVCRNKLLASG